MLLNISWTSKNEALIQTFFEDTSTEIVARCPCDVKWWEGVVGWVRHSHQPTSPTLVNPTLIGCIIIMFIYPLSHDFTNFNSILFLLELQVLQGGEYLDLILFVYCKNLVIYVVMANKKPN